MARAPACRSAQGAPANWSPSRPRARRPHPDPSNAGPRPPARRLPPRQLGRPTGRRPPPPRGVQVEGSWAGARAPL
ncbi:hypothetical protein CNMCM6457_009074 [Aspergillus fumigatiaffinis]|nr:hypothetical protein CNMCM6457_009074 [Aspergillus fumigatiaffinis]